MAESAEQFDVIVVGSGAAGLTGALAAARAGRRVLVLERSELVGGSTAMSGGFVWAPNHHLLATAGIADSRQDALGYCLATTAGGALVETFVDTIPEAVAWLETQCPIRWKPMEYPDSFAELPTGRRCGRHLEVQPFDAPALGDWRARVRMPAIPVVFTADEVFAHQLPLTPAGMQGEMLELLAGRMAASQWCGGAGLVGGLLAGCLDAGVELRLNVRIRQLQRAGGRVVGVVADGGELHASDGVLLACGGFEWDERLKAELLVSPLTHPASPPLHEGDGLRMASAAGARLAHLAETWSWPTLPSAGGEDPTGRAPSPLCMAERMAPHAIWVNRRGRRFTNESAHNCALAFAEVDPATGRWANVPAWVVVDAQYRSRYWFGGLPPGAGDPPAAVSGATVRELAERCGVDGDGLVGAIGRFNDCVAAGADAEFGRGATAYEHYMGDRSAPHPNLGALREAPFSALPLHPGAVGTKGGPVTDGRGRVLDHDDRPIPGLYAAGNTAARILGPGTNAGGATIASALVLGYRAGRNLGGAS
jgi:succinate dehydrogenase/fumarate reductase flavoprotein subunit